jgi:anti-sigma factor RsiW
METWLTSLLLGELSEGEAAAVRALMAHDPELAKLHDRLKESHRSRAANRAANGAAGAG